jgi:hypothetical protein
MRKGLLLLGIFGFISLVLPVTPRSFTSSYFAFDPYYVRPTSPPDTRVKVEIVVKDDLNDEEIDRIERVTFNNKRLSLKPADFMGNRGSFYFRTNPGRYEFTWTIRRKTGFPTVQTFRNTITVPPGAKLVYIEIFRDQLQSQLIQ